MKTEKVQTVIAAVWLGVGVVNGAIALNENQEASKARGVELALESQGNPQAAEWQSLAHSKEHDRNIFLVLVATDVGVAALNGAAAARATKQSSEL